MNSISLDLELLSRISGQPFIYGQVSNKGESGEIKFTIGRFYSPMRLSVSNKSINYQTDGLVRTSLYKWDKGSQGISDNGTDEFISIPTPDLINFPQKKLYSILSSSGETTFLVYQAKKILSLGEEIRALIQYKESGFWLPKNHKADMGIWVAKIFQRSYQGFQGSKEDLPDLRLW